MIQILWLLDFWALLLIRFVLGFDFFQEFKNFNSRPVNKILAIFFLTLTYLLWLGYFTSFVCFIFLIKELVYLFRSFFSKKVSLINVYRLTLLLTLLFIGPGKLSLDYLFNVRF